MKIQQVIIILIVVLSLILVGVAGVALWVYFTTATVPQTNTTQTPQSTNPQNTTGQTPVQTPVSTTEEDDPKKKYDPLFVSLGATRASYELVGSTEGRLGNVYKLYAEDLELAKKMQPDAAGYPIHIASTDLNSDGVAEVLVYEDMPGLCGTGGCTIDVYKRNGTTYENILTTLGYEMIGISKTKTSGYADLFISVHGNDGFMSSVIKFSWDGSKYQQQGVVAVWDGTTFNLVK